MPSIAEEKLTGAPAAPRRSCFLVEDRQEFLHRFDRQPFEVKHTLTADHPLFQLDRMRKLSEFLRKNDYHVHCDAGDIQIGQRWDQAPKRQWSFDETFERIEQANAWIFLKQVEKDPEYGELLDQFMEEVSELSGRDIRREQRITEAIIFITSPRRITTYHIDRECNFLLQVSGDKDIHIFDRNDREVLPEEEIEKFWSVDNNAAVYRPQFEDRSQVFRLQPGNGVHIPVNCPHWLQNGDRPSISFSVSYQFKDSVRKHIYQSNYYLRRMGLRPTPPGRNLAADATKRIAMGGIHALRGGLKKLPGIGGRSSTSS